MTRRNDTIFALATPPGKSAVQIIRISGPGSARALRAFTGQLPQPRQAHYATITAPSGELIDQALVLFFKGPASATGEDTAEIHLHGSPVLGRIVMEALDEMQHFRLADPGEFTRRSFLNGKINLDQAEGIADIIDANTISQHQQAIQQLDGALSQKTDEWRQVIISIAAELAALIDFADEDLPDDVAEQMLARLQGLVTDLDDALRSGQQGMIRRDGIKIALVGKPNAGKSTLLNHLTGDDRAIVSPEAGTTRDLVDVAMDINGVFVTLTDTAGLRQDTGLVETEGVRRAIKAAQDAQLVLLLIDANDENPLATYQELMAEIQPQELQGDKTPQQITHQRIMPLLSKSDTIQSDSKKSAGLLPEWPQISVKTGHGLAVLDQLLHQHIEMLLPEGEAPVLTRQRHMKHVKDAVGYLQDAAQHNPQESPELMAEDLRLAVSALGRISGHVDVEDLLDHIFSSFCIGK